MVQKAARARETRAWDEQRGSNQRNYDIKPTAVGRARWPEQLIRAGSYPGHLSRGYGVIVLLLRRSVDIGRGEHTLFRATTRGSVIFFSHRRWSSLRERERRGETRVRRANPERGRDRGVVGHSSETINKANSGRTREGRPSDANYDNPSRLVARAAGVGGEGYRTAAPIRTTQEADTLPETKQGARVRRCPGPWGEGSREGADVSENCSHKNRSRQSSRESWFCPHSHQRRGEAAPGRGQRFTLWGGSRLTRPRWGVNCLHMKQRVVVKLLHARKRDERCGCELAMTEIKVGFTNGRGPRARRPEVLCGPFPKVS